MPMLERFTAKGGALLVVDLQERLLPAILDRDRLLANTVRLALAARMLDVPAFATEQYPKGLGPTVPELAGIFPDRPAKLSFHGCGAPGIVEGLAAAGARHVTLAGSRPTSAWRRRPWNSSGLVIASRCPLTPSARGTGSTSTSPSAASNTPEPSSPPPRPRCSSGSKPADHPHFKRISALVKDRPAD